LGEDDFPDECGEEGVNMPYFNLINFNHKVLLRDKSENTKQFYKVESLMSLRIGGGRR